jgi:hypothetical protein
VWYKVEEEVLHNAGNKPGELSVHMMDVSTDEGVITEPEREAADALGVPNPKNIDVVMDIIIVYCWDNGTPDDFTDDNVLHMVTGAVNYTQAYNMLIAGGVPAANIIACGKFNGNNGNAGIVCNWQTLDDYMEPGEKSTLQILMHLPQGAPGSVIDANLYQGDSVTFTTQLKLVEVPVK